MEHEGVEIYKNEFEEIHNKYGKYHRLGSPAIVYKYPILKADEYWVNGQRIEDFAKESNIDLPNASDEDWELIKIKFGEPKPIEQFPPLNFNIQKTLVNAKTRALSATWVFEQDGEIETFMDDDFVSDLDKHITENLSDEEIQQILDRGNK